jgi:hypothetical protein
MVSKSISLGDGNAAEVVDLDAARTLVQAFDGVCKVGVFYPPGHALCDQAAEAYLRAMIRVIGPAAGLTIVIERTAFLVQGAALEAEPGAATRMRELLDSLGIVRVDLHRDLTADDLYAFVRALFAHRSRLRNATTFQQLAVGDLPSRVRVHLREFLAGPVDGGGGGGGGGGEQLPPEMAALLTTFTRLGLNVEQQAACRRVLLAIPDRIAQRRAVEGVRAPVKWPDVETILRYAVGDTPAPANLAAGVETLARMLRSLSGGNAGLDPSQAVDLLVSLSARAQAQNSPAPVKPAAPIAPGNLPAMAPDALQEFLLVDDEPDAAVLAVEDRRELLAILLLLQRREQKPAVRTRIEHLLRDAIATGLAAEEESVLAEALREMAADGQTCLASATVLVCSGLRRRSPHGGLAFMCGLAARCDEEQFAGVWPFLVNEILVTGPGSAPELCAEACARAVSLSDDAARVALPRLESLECLHGQRIAGDVFRSPSADLRRVLAWLLETSRGALVARQLATTMRESSAGGLIGAVLPLIDQGTAPQRQLLAAWLRAPDPAKPGDDVLQLAAPLLAVGLAGLPADRRREPWVAGAIAVLRRCRTPLSMEILRRIVSERRFLLFRAWPAACRRAAAAAIAEAP